jgi:acetyltransferase-like isoleucine patch superfamily enzyme
MEWERVDLRVVIKDVPPNAVAVGNPAKVLRIVNKEER